MARLLLAVAAVFSGTDGDCHGAHWPAGGLAASGAVMLCSGGGHSGAGRSRWSRDPNMLKERKQLDKWRKDILYGWFMDDQEQQLSIWCDPVLSTMADPEYHAATTPAGVLQVWFGSQDPAEDAVNPHMWDTRSQEVRVELAETCGALFETALCDAAELSAWDETPQGALARVLLLGPIGEALQYENGVRKADWKRREELSRAAALRCLPRHAAAFAPAQRAFAARPLLLSRSNGDRRRGLAALSGAVPPFLARQMDIARGQAHDLPDRRRYLKEMKDLALLAPPPASPHAPAEGAAAAAAEGGAQEAAPPQEGTQEPSVDDWLTGGASGWGDDSGS